MEPARLISLGTIASLVPEMPFFFYVSVMFECFFVVVVGSGFQPTTLARLVRTLEQLA